MCGGIGLLYEVSIIIVRKSEKVVHTGTLVVCSRSRRVPAVERRETYRLGYQSVIGFVCDKK